MIVARWSRAGTGFALVLQLAVGCGGSDRAVGPIDPPPITPIVTPAPSGHIVFTSTRATGSRDLYIMDALTGTVALVLADPAGAETPVLSPNGHRIAFSSTRDGNPEIYVVNTDGTGLIRVTTNTVNDRSPAWSPDGTRLIFVRTSDASVGGQFVIAPVSGSGETSIPGVVGDSPAWGPNGVTIAYQSGVLLRLVNIDGSGSVALDSARAADDVAWSPDGTKIAFGGYGDGQEIMVINANGTGLRNLTNSPAPAGEIQPTWSPDGNYIAFTGFRNGNDEIVRRKLDGTGEVILAAHPGEDQHPSWGP